ncbi:formyltransferase family protein [Lentzea sp. NPDC051213]|uniref:formyltransferase family protein n=1 Tax=Lentzea sp. NPDC051213 TaxID=3364126 RepID=UPI0037A42878
MMRSYVVMIAGPCDTDLRGSLESWLRGLGARLGTNVRAFSDRDKKLAYVRIEFSCLAGLHELQADLESRVSHWLLEAWQVQSLERPKILVLASRTDHCVHGLLALQQQGRLDGDIVAVASNHQLLRGLVEVYSVPYIHIDWPADPDGAVTAHAELVQLIKRTDADLVVMARFMQIVPEEVCRLVTVINAHHDDTQRHRGANPYARVRQYGNRTIAATAHYATKVLDAGQIIAQESRNIDGLGPMPSTSELSSEGRQVEVTALLTAVRRHVRGEVFVLGDRTMHFPA